MKQQLQKVFIQNDFEGVWLRGENQKTSNTGRNPNINTLHYNVPNNHNLNLTINYPGMKSTRNKYGFVYDYRVDMNGVAISHANIIVDLYNKSLQLPGDTGILVNFLYDLAVNGDGYSQATHKKLSNEDFTHPSEEIINYVNTVHRNLGKVYPQTGNRNWNYSIDQLAHLIMWIVLQEDINYPMPRLQGRRMPFYRYLETIYCAQNRNDHLHTLAIVVERALSHTQPPLWRECNINYRQIENLI
jgi:hypothetical protein